jgi:hypothetical protein
MEARSRWPSIINEKTFSYFKRVGLEKRTAAHAHRCFKRKNGGFGHAQFCTEAARLDRREPAMTQEPQSSGC